MTLQFNWLIPIAFTAGMLIGAALMVLIGTIWVSGDMSKGERGYGPGER